MTYSAGIIGCGWIGLGLSEKTGNRKPDTHYQAYLDNPQVDLVALCDKKYRSNTKNKVIPLYHDYMDMMDTGIDIVSVCTPPETHWPIVCEIVPFVKAIYCEKPMASTLKECDQMIDVCDKYNTLLVINHQRRFMLPVFRFSRDIIDTGGHAFDLLRKLFGEIVSLDEETAVFKSGQCVRLEYVDTTGLPWAESHIFEFDCTHNKERMIPYGVQHIVDCLDKGITHSPLSGGEDGREALKLAMRFKELYENQASCSNS